MKVTEFKKGDLQREILLGMIASTDALAQVSEIQPRPRFPNPECATLARLCLDYYREHGKAPRKGIVSLFRAWASHKDEESVESVDRMLGIILTEYTPDEEINADHIFSIAARYFAEQHARRTVEEAQGFLDLGKLDNAHEALETYGKIQTTKADSGFVLNDSALMKKSLGRKRRTNLFDYPGDLGRFFDGAFKRGDLTSFMGEEGVGKTAWLIDVAIRALSARRKVAFFSIGDLTWDQLLLRFAVRIAELPRYDRTVNFPIRFVSASDPEQPEIAEFEQRELQGVDANSGWEQIQRFNRRVVKSDKPYFFAANHEAGVLTVEDIRNQLRELHRRQDFQADVVIIDYSDLLAPPSGTYKDQARDQINKTWIQLRALAGSKEYGRLVVTATQTNRPSYKSKLIRKEHVGEDKRKLAHAAYMIGLRMQDSDKERGITRLNYAKGREIDFSPRRTAAALGCWDLWAPAVLSIF